MASNMQDVQNMRELSLNKYETGQNYTMSVPEKVYKQCFEDSSGMMAELLFQKIEQTYTINGVPKQKTLDYPESLKILLEMGLLDSVVKSAKQAEHITIGVKTKFDSISTAAYSKEIADETIQEFSDMAPGKLNSKQKVRFMEILAASMPEDQESGRTSPALSQESQADNQSICDSEDQNGQGRVFWTHEAILLLIERRRELSSFFESSTVTQRQAWRKVADELQAKGYKYSGDDCSKKFRSLRARHKTIKEKNSQTGNSRKSWRYYDLMDEMYAGDPAVIPSVVVSSMRQETVPSTPVSQVREEEPPSEQLSSTPRLPRKRRRSSVDTEEPPQWFEKYQETQREMHDERMALERRRVSALESLVNLLQQKQ